jgi:hypothetical protein
MATDGHPYTIRIAAEAALREAHNRALFSAKERAPALI